MAEQKSAAPGIILLLVIGVVCYFMWKGADNKPVHEKKPTASVVGVWKFSALGTDTLILRNNSTFEVQIGGQTYNSGDYRVDATVTPAHFSLIPKKVYWFAGYPALPLTKGIVRFTDINVMELSFKIDPGSRQIGSDFPATFDYPNIRVTLQRIP